MLSSIFPSIFFTKKETLNFLANVPSTASINNAIPKNKKTEVKLDKYNELINRNGLDLKIVPYLFKPAFETFLMACLGTMLGLIMSLPVAWLGAKNVTPLGMFSFSFARMLMTISRSVHEIIWALIFVGAVGLGALPGILALAFRSVGFISKIISESIEGADKKPIEAIRAAGGSGFDVMYYGIIPQILPTVIGTIIFEWDINIRRSAVMGLVGAGGLGLAFFRQMHMSNYPGVTTVIMFIVGLILVGEVLSHYLRKRII